MRRSFDKVLNVEKRGMPLEKKIYPWKSTETETSFWFTPWDDIVRWTGSTRNFGGYVS